MSAGVTGGSAPERGDRCGCSEGISWLLLSPGSRSPGSAEGGSARAEQCGRGDVPRLMAPHPLPAAGSETGAVRPRVCARASSLLSLAFWVTCKTGLVLLIL